MQYDRELLLLVCCILQMAQPQRHKPVLRLFLSGTSPYGRKSWSSGTMVQGLRCHTMSSVHPCPFEVCCSFHSDPCSSCGSSKFNASNCHRAACYSSTSMCKTKVIGHRNAWYLKQNDRQYWSLDVCSVQTRCQGIQGRDFKAD